MSNQTTEEDQLVLASTNESLRRVSLPPQDQIDFFFEFFLPGESSMNCAQSILTYLLLNITMCY